MRAFLLLLGVFWQKLAYKIGTSAYRYGIKAAAPWNAKARKMEHGRRDWPSRLQQAWQSPEPGHKTLWMHCASLGEFEQGRPVIEAYKAQFPDHNILLTFFSPSGYEIRKDYPLASLVTYLPYDSPDNARQFLDIIQPDLAIFVKYEFWAHYLTELQKRDIPSLLISAIFRAEQIFFKPYGGYFRSLLVSYDKIFVQNENSAKLLAQVNHQNTVVAGDTRFDRVIEIARNPKDLPEIKSFVNDKPTLVIGSSWPQDIDVLLPLIKKYNQQFKFIVAPHEIDATSVNELENQLAQIKSVRYTQLSSASNPSASVLIVDTIGMLSSLYQYASWAYIGGSFGKGLHNTLEAAVWGVPIFFGSKNYQKFAEAKGLINAGAAYPVTNSQELLQVFENLSIDSANYRKAGQASKKYVEQGAGATGMIIQYIKNLYERSE